MFKAPTRCRRIRIYAKHLGQENDKKKKKKKKNKNTEWNSNKNVKRRLRREQVTHGQTPPADDAGAQRKKTIKILMPIYSVSSYTRFHLKLNSIFRIFFFFSCSFLPPALILLYCVSHSSRIQDDSFITRRPATVLSFIIIMRTTVVRFLEFRSYYYILSCTVHNFNVYVRILNTFTTFTRYVVH